MGLYHLLNSENKEIRILAEKIISQQNKCKHEFEDEWQEYNIYYQRCNKCAYLKSTEY